MAYRLCGLAYGYRGVSFGQSTCHSETEGIDTFVSTSALDSEFGLEWSERRVLAEKGPSMSSLEGDSCSVRT